MKTENKSFTRLKFMAIVSLLAFSSCEKFLEVEPSKSRVTTDQVFSSDQTATSAMSGVYYNLISAGFASGDYNSITVLSSLSSDELVSSDAIAYQQFEDAALLPTNSYVLDIWQSCYKSIYDTNAMIEGLSMSNSITSKTKNQLRGESLFIRAFAHFYLTNLFGDVPIVLTTDYRANSILKRESKNKVYDQIIFDLTIAETLVSPDYVSNERVRANKAAIQALLSRTYLYKQDYLNAEKYATLVIENSMYQLCNDLNDVFKANSTEAILQLKPIIPGYNTNEGKFFTINSVGEINANVINESFYNQFSSSDQRKVAWVGSFVDGTKSYNFPSKYKIFIGSNLDEYSMVLRLAELYLIRAEARAVQGKLGEAIDDIKAIRTRSGLETNIATDERVILDAIEQERKFELFTEWGHRWLDLKRLNKTNQVLSPQKPNWNETDVLYPIPQSEVNKNKNLNPQNSGY